MSLVDIGAQIGALARQVGARLAEPKRNETLAPLFRLVEVDTYNAGPPRTVDVLMDGGTVPEVPLLDHHVDDPTEGDFVWIVRVRPGGWLYHGKQG